MEQKTSPYISTEQFKAKADELMSALHDHKIQAKDRFHVAEKRLKEAKIEWRSAFEEWNMVEQRTNALLDVTATILRSFEP